jgi:two-component system LytT family response regulator
MITACIIDDEFHSRQSLVDILEEFCPEVTVVGTAENAVEGKALIDEKKPNLIFLDIQMPGKTGIALMDDINVHESSVIFTTAHNQYVLPALRSGAIDYLEKPIDIEDLISAVNRVLNKPAATSDGVSSIKKYASKIVIPLQESTKIIQVKDIVMFEANDGYTYIHLYNEKKMLSSRSIKWFEEKVNPNHFFRTHKSYLINWKHHVSEVLKHGGCSIKMSNDLEIPVSRRKLVELNIRLAIWS